MIRRKTSRTIRKIHRYLGLFIGVQFLFWTISGLYFSWTDIDRIRGDHLKDTAYVPETHDHLLCLSDLEIDERIYALELRDVGGVPHYWINDHLLVDATNGQLRPGISSDEACQIARARMAPELALVSVEQIDMVSAHHEYRDRPLPAYVVSFDGQTEVKAYVSQADGKFQTVRHQSWRWFDWLWMTHTMDYQGRDNFNTTVLRAFSLLGLLTVFSGFLLWFVSSPSLRKLLQ